MQSRSFFATFQMIVGATLQLGCGGCINDEAYLREMDPRLLASALEDGLVSTAECIELCGRDNAESCTLTWEGDLESLTSLGPVSSPSAAGDPLHAAGGAPPSSFGGASNSSISGMSLGGFGGESLALGGYGGEFGLGGFGGMTQEPAASGGTPGEPNGAGGSTPTSDFVVRCDLIGVVSFCGGRRHASWAHRAEPSGTDEVGVWLAQAAADEAGSVHSFRSLKRELRGLGPSGLHRALCRAARQEISHTRLLTRLARLRGATRPPQSFLPHQKRSLYEVAVENVREGCVSEAFAGLIATHQARTARDPSIRAAFEQIAREEAEHAELAWQLHEHLLNALLPDERRQLNGHLERAISNLEQDHARSSDGLGSALTSSCRAHARTCLGLPQPEIEEKMRRHLGLELRSRAQPEAR